ncbi:MAG: NAD(P)/FAD-dependent oxidoreductase [Candidatus Altiarchaeota archaeon]|nr:NAD(P)/FAD-dependent oxidoreductase [Candidatus Altiarchaeota archaeon]
MEFYETVIVGAGPAGLTCAEVLGKGNKEVLVLEKGNVIGNKICAGGMSTKDLRLPKKIIQRKFNGIVLNTARQRVEVNTKSPFLMTVNRGDLGKFMATKVRKVGVEIRTKSRVTKIEKNCLTVNDTQKIKFKNLIGADGPTSIVRTKLGLPTKRAHLAFQYIVPKKFKTLEIFFDFKKFGAMYAWIFPHKSETSIGSGYCLCNDAGLTKFGMTPKLMKENFDQWFKEQYDGRARFEAGLINYDYRGHDFGNRFLIGEAAGLVSGFTGEGIFFAIESGKDVAERIITGKQTYSRIKHLMWIKGAHERLLRAVGKNNLVSKVLVGSAPLLLRWPFLGKKILRKMVY